jgi:phosphoketolase
VDGLPVEGTWRAHQVPLAEVRTNPEHLAQLEAWMRSYHAEVRLPRPQTDVGLRTVQRREGSA